MSTGRSARLPDDLSMNTWLKRILIALVALTLLAVAGVAVFVLTFDQTVYKGRLQAAVLEQFDRTLRIDGNLELSVFPRVALTVQGLSLSEKGRTEPFASVTRAGVALELWPLLHRRLVIDGITVSGLDMQIVRTRDGRLNISDLFRPVNVVTAASDTDDWSLGGSGAVQIDISSLTIRDAQIRLLDQRRGVSAGPSRRISGLDVTTGRIALDRPFAVTMSGRYDATAQQAQAQFVLRTRVELQSVAQAISLTETNVVLTQGTLAGPQPLADLEATLSIPTFTIEPEQERVALQNLALRAKGSRDGAPFEVSADLPAFSLSPTRFEAARATGRLRVDGSNAIDVRASLKDFVGTPQSWRSSEVSVDAAYKRGPTVAKVLLISPLEIKPTEASVSLTALHGEINAADPGLPKGLLHVPVTGSVQAVLQSQRLLVDLDLVIDEARRVATTFGGLVGVRSSLALDTQETGSGALAVRGEATGVAIKALAATFGIDSLLDGLGTVGVDLHMLTRGADPASHSLTGTIHTRFDHGSMAGVDLSAGIEALRALTRTDQKAMSIKVDRDRYTSFSAMQADVSFKRGVGHITRLDLVAPALHITQGKPAQLSLVDDTIDLVANVQVMGALGVPGGKIAIQVRELVVPLQVTGALSHPDLTIQWGALASAPLSRVLQQGLLPDFPELRGLVPPMPGPTDPSQQRQQRTPAK